MTDFYENERNVEHYIDMAKGYRGQPNCVPTENGSLRRPGYVFDKPSRHLPPNLESTVFY